MADFSKPVKTDPYYSVIEHYMNNLKEFMTGMLSSNSNIPDGAIRINQSTIEKYNSSTSSWGVLVDLPNLSVDQDKRIFSSNAGFSYSVSANLSWQIAMFPIKLDHGKTVKLNQLSWFVNHTNARLRLIGSITYDGTDHPVTYTSPNYYGFLDIEPNLVLCTNNSGSTKIAFIKVLVYNSGTSVISLTGVDSYSIEVLIS